MDFVALRHVGASQIRDEPKSPTLASGFLTTGQPEKSPDEVFICSLKEIFPFLNMCSKSIEMIFHIKDLCLKND